VIFSFISLFAYIGVARVGVSKHVKFQSDYQIVTSRVVVCCLLSRS